MSCGSPWLVGRSARSGPREGNPGVQGGAAAPRSAAEGDELRIPPGSWDAPPGAGHERETRGSRGEQQPPAAQRRGMSCGSPMARKCRGIRCPKGTVVPAQPGRIPGRSEKILVPAGDLLHSRNLALVTWGQFDGQAGPGNSTPDAL